MPFLLAGISLLFVRGINQELITAAFDTYAVIAGIVLGLAGGTALFRIIINHITFGGYSNLKDIFKNTLKFVVCVGVAPTVIKVAMNMVDETSNALVSKSQHSKTASLLDKADAKKILSDKELSINDFLIGPRVLIAANADIFQWGIRYIVIFIASLLEYLRNLIFAMFVAVTPVFLYFGFMFDIKFFSQSVLSLGVMLLIWPLLSAILLYFSMLVFKSESTSYWTPVSQGVSLLIYGLAQLLLPFLTLKGGIMAASSVTSGVGGMAGTLMKLRGK